MDKVVAAIIVASGTVLAAIITGGGSPSGVPARMGASSADVARDVGSGLCVMGGSHSGERGYVWSDGRCHHLPSR
jgi:hypothetical protein